MGYRYGWRPYVSVATRRQRAAKKIAKLKNSGRIIRPVEIEGLKIVRTFWGEAWCENLETYSDYDNRLPRGRTYTRNGSVLDLQIEPGRVQAMVSGSNVYQVEIGIKPLAKKRWDTIKKQCAGKIDSMVELLQGSISKGVMEIVTRHDKGLFPSPKEISLSCSCPDWATMCKHVAAALYGVGARLDHEPEMLFTLRGVEPTEMIAAAANDTPTTRKSGRGRVLKTNDVSSIFGIDLEMEAGDGGKQTTRPTQRKRKKERKIRATAAGKVKPAARTKVTKKTTSAKPSKSASKKKTSTKRAKTITTKPTAKKTSSAKTTVTKRQKAVTKKTAAKKATSRTPGQKKVVTKKAKARNANPRASARKQPLAKKAISTRARATS